MAADQVLMSSANSKQVGGTHYQQQTGNCPHCGREIQHWDLFARLPYLVGCATKYILRFGLKGGKEDLEKGKHYLEKLEQVHYPAQLTLELGESHAHNADTGVRRTKISRR